MFDISLFIKDFFKLGDPENKDKWVSVRNSMIVHTRKHVPKELLLCRRPNETPEVHSYRLAQYRPITYGSMNRALDELYRIVNGIGYRIICPDNTNELLNQAEYHGMTFMTFMQQIVLRRMIEDPNGLLVWLPIGYSGDSSEKVTPKPVLVLSDNIHYISNDVLSFLSNEKSEVKNGQKVEKSGNVYYIVTRTEFYKLVQVGRKRDETYTLELVYEHNIGEVPCVILGGDMNDVGYYDSFFSPYLAFGDEAICQFSDWQAVMVTSSHPIREEFGIECELVPVQKSSDPIPDGEEIYAGKKYELRPMPKSPYNTIVRDIPGKEQDAFSKPTLDANIPSVRFIHPDIGIAKYAGESWEKLVEMAEDSLHLNLGRGFLSGEAKKEDRKSQQSMIMKIGANFFDNIVLSSVIYVDAYYNYRAADRMGISIDKPSTYDIKSEQDIVDEISTLKEKKAPNFFLANASMDLAKKRFSGDKLMQKVFDIIQIKDPLYIYSVEEKNAMVLSGYVTKEQCIISTMIYTLLVNIAKEMTPQAFIQADASVIIAKLDDKLAEFMPEPVMPLVDENGNVMNGGGGQTGGNTLAQSVGGLTGMIEIAKAVASGLYDLDAAVALVSSRFGISEEDARKQLGTPSISTQQVDTIQKLV